MIHTSEQLKTRQAYPLVLKVAMSKLRIREWYRHHHGKVYVAFSGGKDSTVLLDLVRSEYPDVPAVFADTGLEYPEIRQFVKTIPNVTWVKPKMNFREVVERYGYPVVSKKVSRFTEDIKKPLTEKNKNVQRLRLTGITSDGRKAPSFKLSKKWIYLKDAPFKISDKCCHYLKKSPLDIYAKKSKRKPFIGIMADESRGREKQYYEQGCNAFEQKQPISRPIMFWLEADIWEYIRNNDIPYSKIYDMGESRTGCMWCAFGSHMEKGENRFQRMAKSHPKQYKFCIETLGMAKVLDYIKVPYRPIPEQKALNLEVVE